MVLSIVPFLYKQGLAGWFYKATVIPTIKFDKDFISISGCYPLENYFHLTSLLADNDGS